MAQDIITTDLGCGDQGKGKNVDSLVRTTGADLVVRYSGANQAAHNVVLPDGRHHTFSQIGSGAFTGAKTFLSSFMLINPISLEVEAEVLRQKDVNNPLASLYVDPDCFIITPLQQHVNQLRELSRGDKRHGSCGRGVGEAVKDVRNKVGIKCSDVFDRQNLHKKIDFLWRYKVDQAEQLVNEKSGEVAKKIFNRLRNPKYVEILIAEYERIFLSGVLQLSTFADVMKDTKGQIIFEGSQGILLDENFGFKPHLTHSCIVPINAKKLLGKKKARVIGILRAYATRHGQGPFVTEDTELTKRIPDMHNTANEWQGDFRVGWLDLVAAQYAIAVSDGIDSLSITCVDRLAGFAEVRIVTAYEYLGNYFHNIDDFFDYEIFSGNRIKIKQIKPVKEEERERLTEMLKMCRPLDYEVFKGWRSINQAKKLEDLSKELRKYLDFIQENLRVPIEIVSYGSTFLETIYT